MAHMQTENSDKVCQLSVNFERF